VSWRVHDTRREALIADSAQYGPPVSSCTRARLASTTAHLAESSGRKRRRVYQQRTARQPSTGAHGSDDVGDARRPDAWLDKRTWSVTPGRHLALQSRKLC